MTTWIKKIDTIVNSLAMQALGSAVVGIDATFVSIGETVLSTENNKEAFFNVLANRCYDTVIAMRDYNQKNANLDKHPTEYGSILQKLYVDLPEAKENTSWNDINTAASNPYEKFPSMVKQKFFTKVSVWEYDVSIPDIQLKTAFLNEEAMGAFITGIFTAMYNSMALSYENTGNICRARLIAEKSKMGNGNGYINVLHLYNTETNKSLTVANCLHDADFLRYLAMTIDLYTGRVGNMSKLFNDKSIARHTPKEFLHLDVHSEVAKRMQYFLQSNTYHENLVKLPLYNEVDYWQGTGETYAFADTGKVMVALDESTPEVFTTVSNVVAVMYDDMSIGTTIDNRRTKTARNERDEFTNYFAKAEMGYFNDLMENGIVFYLAEE